MEPPQDVELLRYSPSKIKIVTHEGKKTAQFLCFNQIKRKESREEEKEEENKEELQTSPGVSDCDRVPRIPLIHSVPDVSDLKELSNIPFKNVKNRTLRGTEKCLNRFRRTNQLLDDVTNKISIG